jgi:hypothetical protein
MKFRPDGVQMAGMLVAAAAALPVQAAITVTGCGDTDFGEGCSLRELFLGGTITIGDKLFGTWTGFETTFLFENSTDPKLSRAANIRVTPDDSDPLNPGLRFSTNASDTLSVTGSGVRRTFEIGYTVQTLDGSPRIKDNTLSLGMPIFSGTGGVVALLERACSNGFEFFGQCGTEVAFKSVAADNVEDVFNLVDDENFSPRSQLFVSTFFSLFNSNDGESTALVTWQQYYSQTSVPEPGSFALLGVALAGMWCARTRRKRPANLS